MSEEARKQALPRAPAPENSGPDQVAGKPGPYGYALEESEIVDGTPTGKWLTVGFARTKVEKVPDGHRLIALFTEVPGLYADGPEARPAARAILEVAHHADTPAPLAESQQVDLAELKQAVIKWWEDKRPFGWQHVEHLSSAEVYCVGAEIPLSGIAADLHFPGSAESVTAPRLYEAVLAWWQQMRPFGWKVEEHLEQPEAYCVRAMRPLASLAAKLWLERAAQQ